MNVRTRTQRLSVMFEDLWIILQHVVVPERWWDSLIPVADKWGNFEGRGSLVPNGSTRWNHFRDFIDDLEAGERPALIFAHQLLPHSPFQFLPDGHLYTPGHVIPSLPDGTWRADTELAVHSYRGHLLQLAMTDMILGRLLDRLEVLGILEDAAVVVTADHGISFKVGLNRRSWVPGNEADIMFVPLFFKSPGQSESSIDDRFVQTVDIMPTLASALGMDLPWEHLGLDLLRDPSDRERLPFQDQDAKELRFFGPETLELRDETVAWKAGLFGEDGGIDRLYRGHDPAKLLGRRLQDLDPGSHAVFRTTIRERELLENVDPSGEFVPAQINGLLEGYAGEGRLSLVLTGVTEQGLGATVEWELKMVR